MDRILDGMDQTKCPHCGKRLKPVLSANQRTELRCRLCDDVDPRHTDAVPWLKGSIARSTQTRPPRAS